MFIIAALMAPSAHASEPIRVVSESLEVPVGIEANEALGVVEADLAAIFTRYEPVVPGVPGVRLSLTKEVVSAANPVVLQLPIEGGAFGTPIEERATVVAHTEPHACPGLPGLKIILDFEDSSYNIARRIDRIEILACPRQDEGGLVIDARGEMYAGFLPRDPEKNGIAERVGANALQGAFIKQVPAVFEAVELQWKSGGARSPGDDR